MQRAPRPALRLALALAVGRGLGSWDGLASSWLLAGALACALAGAALAGSAWAAARRRWEGSRQRIDGRERARVRRALIEASSAARARAGRLAVASAPFAAVALVAAVHARAAVPAWPRASARAASEAPATARDDALEGRWRALPGQGPERGWLEGSRDEPSWPWVIDLAGPAPPVGARVRVLPPLEPRPYARGPVPGPAERRGRFAGELPVAADQLRVLALPAGPLRVAREALASVVGGARAALAGRVAGALPAAPGLAAAMLVGEREALTPELRETFRRTGTTHLLALSGMHVVVLAACLIVPVAGAVGALARRARRGASTEDGAARGADLATRLLLLAGFALLVGLAAPIARASVALALAWWTPRLATRGWGRARAGDPGRRLDGLSLWSAALAVELVRSPEALSDVGTQLSYTATLALIVATRPLAEALEGRSPDAPLARSLLWTRSPLRIAGELLVARARRWLAWLVAASTAATIVTAPVLWATFGELSVWSLPASAAAGPLLVPMLAGLWLEAALGTGPWSSAADLSAVALVALLEACDRLPGTPWLAPARPTAWLVATAAVLLAGAAAGAASRRGRVALAAGLVGTGIALLPWRAAPERLSVRLLDVGHGTAAVVEAPGRPLVIFDAGSRDRSGLAREALAPLLAELDPSRPWIVLSHPDRDHWQALPWLVERLPPARWIGPDPAPLGVRLPPGVAHEDLGVGRLELASAASGPVALTVVRGLARDDNEGSRHLVIEARGGRAVLFGDAVAAGLARALELGLVPNSADLVLVPHHGSFGPAAGRLLDALAARRLWVGVDRRPPLADELDRRRTPWQWTGRDGPLGWASARSPDTPATLARSVH